MFKGRSNESKKAIYKAIIDNLAFNPGIVGDDITIVLVEALLENWGINGGKSANNVELGFNINI